MANKYQVVTEFTLLDKTTGALNNMGLAGQAMSKTLQASFNRAQERVNAFGESVKTGLKTAAVVGIGAVVAGIGVATKQFIEFENESRKAGSLFGDLDSAAADFETKLGGIQKTARNVAAATEFNATDTSKSLESFAMAGYDSITAMELLAPTADLATAAQLSLGEATDIATASIGALGMEANSQNLVKISDVFAKTAASSRTSVQTIFEAVQYAGPTFTAAGQSVETLSAAIAALGNAGIDGSNAGTALNAVFVQLSSAAKQKELEQLGVSVKDNAGNFLDLANIVGQLEVALDGLGTAEKSAILNSVFGTRGVKAMNILLDEGSVAFTEYRGTLEAADGAALKMATSMRNSLSNRIEVLKSALTELGFKFVEVFAGKGGDAIGKITEAISNFDPAPIANGLATVITVIGNVAKVAWSMRGAIIAVVAAMGTYRLIMDAAVIATTAYKTITAITMGAQIAYNTVVKGSTAAQAALTFATNQTKVATFIFSGALKAITAIQAGFKAITNSTVVSMIASKVQMAASAVASQAYAVATGIATAATGAFSTAVGILNTLFVATPIGWIVLGIAALIAGIVLLVKNWDSVTAAVAKFGDWLKWLGGVVFEGLKTAWNAVVTGISTAWTWVTDGIKSAFASVAGFIGGIIDGIKGAWDRMVSAFSSGGIIGALKSIGASILSFILAPVEKILGALTWIPGIGDKISQWRDSIASYRADLTGETNDTAIANTAPTQTAATAESYSREESVSTSNIQIGLDKGLTAQTSGAAPGITINRQYSGAF